MTYRATAKESSLLRSSPQTRAANVLRTRPAKANVDPAGCPQPLSWPVALSVIGLLAIASWAAVLAAFCLVYKAADWLGAAAALT